MNKQSLNKYILTIFSLAVGFSGSAALAQTCSVTKRDIDYLSSKELRERIVKAVGSNEVEIAQELQEEADVVMSKIMVCSLKNERLSRAVADFALTQNTMSYESALRKSHADEAMAEQAFSDGTISAYDLERYRNHFRLQREWAQSQQRYFAARFEELRISR